MQYNHLNAYLGWECHMYTICWAITADGSILLCWRCICHDWLSNCLIWRNVRWYCNYKIVWQISFASYGNKQSRCLIKFQVSTRSCFNAPISQTCVEFALVSRENAIFVSWKNTMTKFSLATKLIGFCLSHVKVLLEMLNFECLPETTFATKEMKKKDFMLMVCHSN